MPILVFPLLNYLYGLYHYNEELLNELINFSYNYQDNGMQEERVIDKYNSNEMQDNNFEIQKKSDAKVKKLVR